MNYLHSGYPEEHDDSKCPDIETRLGNYDCVYKVALVGDTSVGKTSLLNRYKHNKFDPRMERTIGVDYVGCTLDYERREKLQVWDTAGMERFRSITQSYYRNMQAIMLVYDVTDAASFQSLPQWHASIVENTPVMPIVSIVGNKLDLCDGNAGRRMVSVNEARRFAMDHGSPFIEVSAKCDINIVDAFATVIEHMRNRSFTRDVASRYERDTVVLDEEAQITAQSEDHINGRCWC